MLQTGKVEELTGLFQSTTVVLEKRFYERIKKFITNREEPLKIDLPSCRRCQDLLSEHPQDGVLKYPKSDITSKK